MEFSGKSPLKLALWLRISAIILVVGSISCAFSGSYNVHPTTISFASRATFERIRS